VNRPVCSPAGQHRCIAAVFAWLLLASASVAAPPPEPAGAAPVLLTAHLNPIWTSPLTRDLAEPALWPTTGFLPGGWAEASGGALVLLGTMYSPGHAERLILRNAERVGPEAAVPLVLPTSEPAGVQRQPGLLFGSRVPNLDRWIGSIAVDGDGAIWVGGGINFFLDIGSSRHGDAYLAKLDEIGRAVWEQAYSDGRLLSVSSIVLRTAGGAIVAGSTFPADTSWLARVGPDGARLQEWRLGNGKGITVLPLQDGRILVAGFADGGVAAGTGSYQDAALAAVKAGSYRDDVVAWVLGETGQLQGPVSVREGISQNDAYRGPHSSAGSITMAAAGNAAFVVSKWLNSANPAGVQVARIGPEGAVTWRQSLPETIAPMDVRRAFSCSPSIAALPDGDALVACALYGQVQLHRFNGKTGKSRSASLTPPRCQKGGYRSSASVIALSDGTVFVLGTGFGNDGDTGCSWMAQLTFDTE